MARVRYLSEADLAPEHHDLLARKLNLYRALAHSPAGARGFSAGALYVRHHSKLDPRLRELAIIQIGYLTRTQYEYAHHLEIGRANGVTDHDFRAIALATAGQPTALTELDSAVLSAARELTAEPSLSDQTFATLRKYLDEERVVDLIITIATYCGVVRLLGALKIDLEVGYEDLLKEFPLPKVPVAHKSEPTAMDTPQSLTIDVPQTVRALESGQVPDWISEHLQQYLATDGQQGHYWDSTPVGGRGVLPCLLLTTRGRRSGQARTMPLAYGSAGDAYVIVGSKGGAETQPAWYWNLQNDPNVEVQIAADRFRARARMPVGNERAHLWQMMVELYPPYATYQQNTSREIPLFVLERN